MIFQYFAPYRQLETLFSAGGPPISLKSEKKMISLLDCALARTYVHVESETNRPPSARGPGPGHRRDAPRGYRHDEDFDQLVLHVLPRPPRGRRGLEDVRPLQQRQRRQDRLRGLPPAAQGQQGLLCRQGPDRDEGPLGLLDQEAGGARLRERNWTTRSPSSTMPPARSATSTFSRKGSATTA